MNVVSFDLDLNSRYNFWSGITGGFFLALSYFGTDQSQVQRYLSGRSVAESRLGLLFNGLLKMPMQFVILLIGVLVFVFYLFTPPPIFFNSPALGARRADARTPASCGAARSATTRAFAAQRAAADAYVAALERGADDAEPAARAELRAAAARTDAVRAEAKALVAAALPERRDEGRRLRVPRLRARATCRAGSSAC